MTKRYRLQRWWIVGGWDTVDSFQPTHKGYQEAHKALKGWRKQIIDGTFRIVKGKRQIAIVTGNLYRARQGKTMRLSQVRKRKKRK